MQPNPDQIMHVVAAMMAIYFVVFLVFMVAIIIPTWFVCKKAGFSPWLSFIVIVPFGGLVLLYVLAFAEWKVIPAPQGYWPQQPYPPAPGPLA